MKKYLFILTAISLLCGCQTLPKEKQSVFRTWAEETLATTTSYPHYDTRTFNLGKGVSLPFTLKIESQEMVQVTSRNFRVVKLKDPSYHGNWAHITLADVNNDGIDDINFTAHPTALPSPVKAVFLYQPDQWEAYLLPQNF